MRSQADMLKNPYKATIFHSDTHDCELHGECLLSPGWLTTLRAYESLVWLFQHVCLANYQRFLATTKLKIRENKIKEGKRWMINW
jgi:hypothetical protein